MLPKNLSEVFRFGKDAVLGSLTTLKKMASSGRASRKNSESQEKKEKEKNTIQSNTATNTTNFKPENTCQIRQTVHHDRGDNINNTNNNTCNNDYQKTLPKPNPPQRPKSLATSNLSNIDYIYDHDAILDPTYSIRYQDLDDSKAIHDVTDMPHSPYSRRPSRPNSSLSGQIRIKSNSRRSYTTSPLYSPVRHNFPDKNKDKVKTKAGTKSKREFPQREDTKI